ncbi:class I SAM-dependent methyltransferase [Marilutibacter penaei]|nr:class I SAM-dependent methyltransferase [Lysobacter penaei]
MSEESSPPLTPESLVEALEKWLGHRHTGYDFVKIGKIMAAADTARFVQEHMPLAPVHRRKRALHEDGFKLARPGGLFLEFGVAGGHSINFIADSNKGATIHGFDSFEGLPEAWTATYKKGHFAQGLPEVRDNVELHVGWFDQSLPPFLESHPGPVSYLHVDCDLYSSTVTIFELLSERIVEGTVIVFDEYFNYPTWRDHEHKAFMEFVARRNVRFRYFGSVNCNKQVGVVIEAIG